MRRISLLFLCLFNVTLINAQQPDSIDSAIEQIWGVQNDQKFLQSLGVESLGQDNAAIAPIIPPARPRQIPGSEQLVIPIEETDGPLNLAPNDAKAYILYNRATIAFRNKQYEQARELYRELVRKYPESSYSPYALYVISLSEQDYRRKIRILLTIKERFPNFQYKDLILDRLGDIYYLLDSPEAADEVLEQSKSGYALYTRALIAMDERKANKAISLIKKYLKLKPDNAAAYQAYLLYAEALMDTKGRGFQNALIILKKAIEFRPWAYDNGALILFNAGKAFYHDKQLQEALYAFSLLRIRFGRMIESRIADQYLMALNRQNVVTMKSVPWIAESFETIIKEQPIVNLRTPSLPSVADMLAINDLPTSAVEEPSLEGVAFLPPMPIPVPPKRTYSVLVPFQENATPQIDLITLTNVVYQEVTNTIQNFVTNSVFVVETNTVTNNITGVLYQTNVLTNILQVWETNNVVTYEPVVVWATNYRDIDLTNLVTNIVEVVVTNEKIELNYLWKTNYNFENRPRSITNRITRYVTNRYLERYPDKPPVWKENIEPRFYLEIVPAWKTPYNTLDTNQLVTNVIREIKTNQKLELVPRWVDNIRTNDTVRIVDTVITNTRLRIAPRWITNYQIIQTNMRDVVITNAVNVVRTNATEQIITNVLNLNSQQARTAETNYITASVTNVVEVDTSYGRTNYRTNNIVRSITNVVLSNQANTYIYTNLVPYVITNYVNSTLTNFDIVTNLVNQIITNYINTNINEGFALTNNAVITNTVLQSKLDIPWTLEGDDYSFKAQDVVIITNIKEVIVTNDTSSSIVKELFQTNLHQVYVTNITPIDMTRTNNITNLTEMVLTNALFQSTVREFFHTNVVERVLTNYFNSAFNRTNFVTNITDLVITNYIGQAARKAITNYVDHFVTNLVNKAFEQTNVRTNFVDSVVTNYIYRSQARTNINTNVTTQIITNYLNAHLEQTNVITNYSEFVSTNLLNTSSSYTNVMTNQVEYIATNLLYQASDLTNILTNEIEYIATNYNYQATDVNVLTNVIEFVATNDNYQAKNFQIILAQASEIEQLTEAIEIKTNANAKVETNTIRFPLNSNDSIWRNPEPMIIPALTILTNRVQKITTNIQDMPYGGLVLYTNIIEYISSNLVNKPFNKTNITTNYTEVILSNQDIISTNVFQILATNIAYLPYGSFNVTTNFQLNIVTNRIKRPFVHTNVSTNIENLIMTNAMNRTDYPFFLEEKAMRMVAQDFSQFEIEVEPQTPIDLTEVGTDADAELDVIDGNTLIVEPFYTPPVESQIDINTEQILRLELEAQRLTEQSASSVGKYSFSNKKGFVIRIVQTKDFSVANIIVKDLSNLNLGAEIGVYFRDEMYFIEIRSLTDQKKVQQIAQRLYENGYTDVQVFEQYEVVEYEDE